MGFGARYPTPRPNKAQIRNTMTEFYPVVTVVRDGQVSFPFYAVAADQEQAQAQAQEQEPEQE